MHGIIFVSTLILNDLEVQLMNMVEIVQLSFSHSSLIINIILITAFILNLIFAFIIIFMERRSAGSIWAWLLILVFLPIVGFILYLLLGRQIQRKHIFKLKKKIVKV